MRNAWATFLQLVLNLKHLHGFLLLAELACNHKYLLKRGDLNPGSLPLSCISGKKKNSQHSEDESLVTSQSLGSKMEFNVQVFSRGVNKENLSVRK